MRTVVPSNASLIPSQAKRVFKGIIFDVYHWQQKMFDDTDATFEMLKRPDTIQVIAIKDNKIVVLEEQQPGRPPFLGLPGGRHDHDDETELDAAAREVREETGLIFKTWKLLAVKQPFIKIDQFVYHFLATDFDHTVVPQLDSGERIEVKLLDFDAVKQLQTDPRVRYLGKDIFDQVNSLQELLDLPEYSPTKAQS